MILRSIVTTMLALASTVAVAAPKPETIWLVIAASDPTAAAIAQKAKGLARSLPHALVVQTRDCGDKKNVFAVAAEVAESADAARDLLPKVQSAVKDAYVKRCAVAPGSLLSLRYPAVDATIADVPDSTANWEEADRVSTVATLPDGRALVLVRYFASDPNDPLEGRRERVVLVSPGVAPNQWKILADDCSNAGAFAAQQGRIAFECAQEVAADQLLHGVLVFDGGGTKLTEVSHCRKPRFAGPAAVVCSEESVDADGKIKFRSKRVNILGAESAGAPKAR